MKVSLSRLIIAIALVITSACSYNVAPTSAPAVNVYSSYDDPIPGRWAIVIDRSSMEFVREVKPSSFVCQAHKYPVDTGTAVTDSVRMTMSKIFAETEFRNSPPSHDAMMRNNMEGYVVVRMDNFSPRLTCTSGWWSASCMSTVDLSFGIEAREVDGEKFATSVGSTKTFDGDSGYYCGRASEVIAEAFRLAVKDAMERLAERASNSHRLRTDQPIPAS